MKIPCFFLFIGGLCFMSAVRGRPATPTDDLDRRLQPVDIRGPSEFFYMVPLFSKQDVLKTEGTGRLDLLDDEEARRRANEAQLVYI